MKTFELPLFPLRTVLFPGAVLPLNIFEPRYLAMVDSALAERRIIGAVEIATDMQEIRKLASALRGMGWSVWGECTGVWSKSAC